MTAAATIAEAKKYPSPVRQPAPRVAEPTRPAQQSEALKQLIEVAETGQIVVLTASPHQVQMLLAQFIERAPYARPGFGIPRSLSFVGKAGVDRLMMEVEGPIGRREDRRTHQNWLPFLRTPETAKWIGDESRAVHGEGRGTATLVVIEEGVWDNGDAIPDLGGAGCVLLANCLPEDGVTFENYKVAK